ncbi:helix-turn-helix domain-containing protein [Haloarcula halophila]|uniref:helix-turn-helix domain-containing protein n=1 Tax=Haloarcula TaxID=2237 RepID=UPI0023E46711|nr:helix-turn-helix domain-containing protein [Halomicroarcula sp. DFY41]
MRYLTLLVEPKGESAFHPLGEELTAAQSIQRRAIHHVELLTDETVLLLAEASGDQEQYREIMERSPHVSSYLTAGEDPWMAVSQFEPTEVVRNSLQLQRESPLVLDTPIRFTADDTLKVTYLGTDDVFSDLYDYVESVDYMDVDVLQTGEYESDGSTFSRMITDRQEEVLETAVELGYYDEPRQASLEDISDVVGIRPGTVGEHLRKAEHRVFSEIVQ